MIDSTHDPPKDEGQTLFAKRPSLTILLALVVACATVPPSPTPSPPSGRATATGSSQAQGPEEEGPSAIPAEEDAGTAKSGDGTPEEQGEEGEGARGQDHDDRSKPGRIVLDTAYDDQRVGEDQTSEIEAELGVIDDEKLLEYVRSVGIRLLRHAPPQPFDYEFKVVDQSVPNAFALPGGKIYVSRGLLALIQTEDELAGVIGHEITHAAERHTAARIDYSRRLNPFSIGYIRAAAIAAYGRDQERDADRGGQILAARAGYDPAGIADFLRKLDASDRYEIGWSRLPYFLATHPTSPERSALASERAAGLEWERAPGIADALPMGYFSVIDGLILGDNPAGGLFEGDRFIHPDLRFSIRFPRGWTTMNTQQAVAALAPSRDAEATLTVEGRGPDIDKVIDEFIESEVDGTRVRVRDRREIKIGELPAVRIEGRASNGMVGLWVQMTFVEYDGLVYRLSLVSLAGAVSKYRGRGRAFAHSFRPLDEAGIHSLKVIRLRIARALENETLQALSERTHNELELVYTGVMNGIYASTPLRKGQLIKIGLAEPYIPPRETDESGKQDETGKAGGTTSEPEGGSTVP